MKDKINLDDEKQTEKKDKQDKNDYASKNVKIAEALQERKKMKKF